MLEADSCFTTISFFFDNVLRGLDTSERNINENKILDDLREKIGKIRKQKPISKIIIIGTSFIPEETIEKIESEFGIPAEMGYTRNVAGNAKDLGNPAHITAVGLALHGIERRKESLQKRGAVANFLGRAGMRTREFLEEYF